MSVHTPAADLLRSEVHADLPSQTDDAVMSRIQDVLAENAALSKRLAEREAQLASFEKEASGTPVADGEDEKGYEAFKTWLFEKGLDSKRFEQRGCKELYLMKKQGESEFSFDAGRIVQKLQKLKVYVLAQVSGEEKCLIHHDQFNLADGQQTTLMLPLETRIRFSAGESWPQAMRRALAEEINMPGDWQDAHLEQRKEGDYYCTEGTDISKLHPDIQVVFQCHEVHIRVKPRMLEEATGNSPFERIGLPSGRDFMTREERGDGRGPLLHVWCWKSREYERNGRMIDFGQYLAARGVKLNEFGVGSNKTLFQFYLEVREKQSCQLEEVKEPTDSETSLGLRRVVELLKVKLIAEVHNSKRVLSQTEEFLDDGRQRNVNQLLVKKMRKGDDWQEALERVIFERLGVDPELQQECFQIDEDSVDYHEETQPSQGYVGILSQYNIRTVTIHVVEPEHPELARIGLPRGNDFVTKEGEMAENKGGSVHVWTWVPVLEEEAQSAFVGTALEDLRRHILDVELLVLQTSSQPRVKEMCLDPPLKQSLEKLKQASELLFDIDRTVTQVDVKKLMGNLRRVSESGNDSDITKDLSGLAAFIKSNFTRSAKDREYQPPSRSNDPVGGREISGGNDCPPITEETLTVDIPLREGANLQDIKTNQDVWGYDFFNLNQDANYHVLETYGEVTLVPPCISSLKCSREVARSFLDKVAKLYMNNPYHGAVHAAQVSHLGAWLIRGLRIVEKQDPIEYAAFIIAGFCHDVKHFGRNNAFCINTEHEYALAYSNQKVLENMHSATCLELLQEEKMLAKLSWNERAVVRTNIIEYILATDMAEHFEGISKFRVRREAPDFDVGNPADRRFVARMCLKAGDIGHSALPWKLHAEWSMRVAMEFFGQGDEERRLGLPISALCDRAMANDIAKSQSGFLEFVCTPLFEVLADFNLDYERERERLQSVAAEKDSPRSHVGSDAGVASVSPRSHGASTSPTARVPSLPHKRRSTRRLSSNKLTAESQTKGVQGVCIALLKTNVVKWREDVEVVERIKAKLASPEAASG